MTKRIFDFSFSFVLILVNLPTWIIAAFAIKLESKGPIFYKSRRVGRNGKEFNLYKFRSMVKNADKIGGGLTVDEDARLTRVGRFIRKWKIDELPNFINVLIGHMSVVGPRPELPQYVQYYSEEQRKVLSVKPGITDIPMSDLYYNEQEILASVKDPHDYYVNVILQDFLKLNLKYVARESSLLYDMRIMAKTARSIFFNHKSGSVRKEPLKSKRILEENSIT